MRQAIAAPGAPRAIGPYSPVIRAGHFLFLSGQIPIDPASGALVDGDIRAQTEQVMRNISALLEAAGAGFEQWPNHGVLADMNEFAAMTSATRVVVDSTAAAQPCRWARLPRYARGRSTLLLSARRCLRAGSSFHPDAFHRLDRLITFRGCLCPDLDRHVDAGLVVAPGPGFHVRDVGVDVRDLRADLRQHAPAVFDLHREAHGVRGLVAAGAIPFDVDAALGVEHEIEHVRTAGGMHGDALPARDVAHDPLAADRIAALRTEYINVVGPEP